MNKFSQKSLEYKVLKNIKKNDLVNPDDHVVVAVSGGRDSICLLDILMKLKEELKVEVSVCHYNHKLRGKESDNDEEFVKNFCENRGVKCIIGRAEKENLYKNEDEAREARYGFFEKILEEGGGSKLAMAHNSNDLAETLLMRLVRGTGLKGLTSIPLARKKIIRPLLYFSRSEINGYVEKNRLAFVEDTTNLDIRFDRNFIRHKILPLIQELNPNFFQTVVGTVESLNEDYELIGALTEEAYNSILDNKNENKIVLSRDKWMNLHVSLKKTVLRKAISEVSDLKNITQKHINEAFHVIYKGHGEKHKLLPSSLRIELISGKIIISKSK